MTTDHKWRGFNIERSHSKLHLDKVSISRGTNRHLETTHIVILGNLLNQDSTCCCCWLRLLINHQFVRQFTMRLTHTKQISTIKIQMWVFTLFLTTHCQCRHMTPLFRQSILTTMETGRFSCNREHKLGLNPPSCPIIKDISLTSAWSVLQFLPANAFSTTSTSLCDKLETAVFLCLGLHCWVMKLAH